MIEIWNLSHSQVERMMITVVLVLWRYLKYLRPEAHFSFKLGNLTEYTELIRLCYYCLCGSGRRKIDNTRRAHLWHLLCASCVKFLHQHHLLR